MLQLEPFNVVHPAHTARSASAPGHRSPVASKALQSLTRDLDRLENSTLPRQLAIQRALIPTDGPAPQFYRDSVNHRHLDTGKILLALRRRPDFSLLQLLDSLGA